MDIGQRNWRIRLYLSYFERNTGRKKIVWTVDREIENSAISFVFQEKYREKRLCGQWTEKLEDPAKSFVF